MLKTATGAPRMATTTAENAVPGKIGWPPFSRSEETPLETLHNPDRFMSDLRQILSQGRKRIGLLVGAGAPLAVKVDDKNKLSDTGKPLIPGVDQLTASVI